MEETLPKSSQPVLGVLCSKHLESRPPTERSLEAYRGKPPEMALVDIVDATLATVARQLLGSAGIIGVDSISLKHWLLRFGVSSLGLRQIFEEFGDWMANGGPPWAAYSSMMLGRLFGLNKCDGVHLVGVGETWRRMLKKCVLVVMG